MAQLGDLVAGYHQLLEQDEYGNPVWAEQLQERMRQLHLTESGRILAPILRPHFISRRQLDLLTNTTARLTEILARLEQIVFASPALLDRLQMLPAEKVLATVPRGYSGFSIAASMDTHVRNNSLILQGFNACKPAGLAYADLLADLFLELPLVKKFKQTCYRLSKLGSPRLPLQAIQAVWREFQGGKTRPTVAVVEMSQEPGAALTEGHLLAESFRRQGVAARVVAPERLQYSGGRLHSGDFLIDVVFRRMLTRELLARFELSHPLLEAYRKRAVCVVNSFRSEFAQRRSLFDLLTDETVTGSLPASDRKMIRAVVPWTRIVSARKTKHLDQTIDLPEFILKHREELALLPMEDGTDERVYVGHGMAPSAWDRAVRQALRTPYVVQERPTTDSELFPFYQYGEVKMKIAEVSIHPHIFNGQMNDASAVLHHCVEGSAAQLAVAPVLLLEKA